MVEVTGLRPNQLASLRRHLDGFTAETFEAMRHRNQRRRGEVYLHGPMLDGMRKSIEPLVEQLRMATSSA